MEDDANKSNKLKNIKDIIEPTLVILKIQVNLFLFIEIKEFVAKISFRKFDFSEIPEHFPEKVKLIIKSLFTQLKHESEKRILEIITELKYQITLTSSPEKKLGEVGNILLAANSIKSLPVNHITKLLNILSAPSNSKIEDFLKDPEMNINYDTLETEIKGKMIKNKPIPNLKTLISQISKEKPLDPSLFQRIMDNQNDMNVFKDKCLYISNTDYSLSINGKIKETSFSKKQAIFKFQNNINNYKISLNLEAGYINSAIVNSEFYQTLASSQFIINHKYI